MATPVLDGNALAAVEHRGSHLQIIASAGSGKTEVVSQQVAALLAEGVPPTAKAGRLRPVKIDARTLIAAVELDRFVAEEVRPG